MHFFACKQEVETVKHFLLERPGFKGDLDLLLDELITKGRDLDLADGDQIVNFIASLDQHHKMLFLLGFPSYHLII